jgi:hypothetical protein
MDSTGPASSWRCGGGPCSRIDEYSPHRTCFEDGSQPPTASAPFVELANADETTEGAVQGGESSPWFFSSTFAGRLFIDSLQRCSVRLACGEGHGKDFKLIPSRSFAGSKLIRMPLRHASIVRSPRLHIPTFAPPSQFEEQSQVTRGVPNPISSDSYWAIRTKASVDAACLLCETSGLLIELDLSVTRTGFWTRCYCWPLQAQWVCIAGNGTLVPPALAPELRPHLLTESTPPLTTIKTDTLHRLPVPDSDGIKGESS